MYSTAAWQRLRRQVLARDGYTCMIRGPRCTGIGTTAHHIIPSSQAPDRFFDPDNLVAACRPCNYGHGARLATQNKRAAVAQLRETVYAQAQEIDRLLARIAELERNGDPEPEPEPEPVERRQPAVY